VRILVAHSYYRVPGGEDRYVDQLVGLLGSRHDVRLVKRANMDLSYGPGTAARMIYSPGERASLDRTIDAFRPDVIHLHNPYPSLGPSVHLAAASHGIPLVATAHNFRLRCPNGLMYTEGAPCRRCEAGAYGNAITHHCFPSRFQAAAYASALWLHRFGLRLEHLVDVHIAPSRFMRRRLEDWGIAPDRIALVRNFTDLDTGLPDPGIDGMYLGRLSDEKGLDVLLQALRVAGDPPFRIVGSGPAAQALAVYARSIGIRNTSFLGRLDRNAVVRELASARFVAFPSTWDENAPLAALEAMAAGRPLLVTRTGGLEELIEGGTGLACDAGDVAGMATAITTLMADDELCVRMGQRATQVVQAEHRPDRHLDRLEEIYRSLVVPSRSFAVPAGGRSYVPNVPLVATVPRDSVSARPSVLMVHCYYRDLGGENLSFEAEASLLRQSGRRIHVYTRSNREIDGLGTFGRARAAARTVWADDAYRAVDAIVRRERPQVAHFQNTFPLISPSVYHACRRHGVAVVQALRNYRLTCVNGLLFRDGRVCEDCLGRTIPWPGVLHACYRSSVTQSGVAAGMIATHNVLGTWARDVDAYVVPSEFSRSKYVQAGLSAEKVFVKPNFVYPDPGPNSGPGRYALFAGRLASEKGILTVLEAWRRVGDIPLRIVGDGPLTGDVRRAIASMGLSPNVQLVGHLPPEGVIEEMRGARVAIFPSEWYETFGRVAAEAFACGVPVIASRIGAMAEVVVDRQTGRLFSPADPEDLAAKVAWAWEHPTDLQQLSRQARLEFERRFTAAHNLELLDRLYETAIARARGRTSGSRD
jgi:glycosyltransferase involved in cell wall biosynthesis